MITIAAALSRTLDALAGRRQALDDDDSPNLRDYDADMDEGHDTTELRTPAWTPEIPPRLPLPRRPPPPIITGDHDEPEIADFLADMRKVWTAHGVPADYDKITPREFCELPKAPGRPVSIPQRTLWPWTAYLIREVFVPLREKCGPMSTRGFRPSAYNEAVGGSRNSDHQWACAFDLRPAGGQSINLLKREAAKLYLQRGAELKLGFGAYPGNIHLGAGIRQRYWGDAGKWIKHVRTGR